MLKQAGKPSNHTPRPIDEFKRATRKSGGNSGTFLELAALLFNATEHELNGVSSYLGIIRRSLIDSKSDTPRARFSNREIKSMREFILAENKIKRYWELTRQLQKLRARCERNGDSENLDGNLLRTETLQNIREIKPLLVYFGKMLERYKEILLSKDTFKEEFDKKLNGIKLGIQIMEFLEGTLIGKFEFNELLGSRFAARDANGGYPHECVIQDIQYACLGLVISRDKTDKKDIGVQVLTNKLFDLLIAQSIVNNAKRGADQKGIDLELDIYIHREGDRVLFEFKDNGCGMSPELMEKLNKGEQATTKTEEGRHGLGFWYCRQLAEKMGGTLYVKESTINFGTTVVWELKIADNSQPAYSHI